MSGAEEHHQEKVMLTLKREKKMRSEENMESALVRCRLFWLGSKTEYLIILDTPISQ